LAGFAHTSAWIPEKHDDTGEGRCSMIKRRIVAAAAGLALAFGALVATGSAAEDTAANGLKVSTSSVVKANGLKRANGL
jgi:uncharacterized membrane protein